MVRIATGSARSTISCVFSIYRSGPKRRKRTTLPVAFGPDGLAAWVELDELDVPTVIVRRQAHAATAQAGAKVAAVWSGIAAALGAVLCLDIGDAIAALWDCMSGE